MACAVCGGDGCGVLPEGQLVDGVVARAAVLCSRPPACAKGDVVNGMVAVFSGPNAKGARFFVDRGSWLRAQGPVRGLEAWHAAEGLDAAPAAEVIGVPADRMGPGVRFVSGYAFADGVKPAAVLAVYGVAGDVVGVLAFAADLASRDGEVPAGCTVRLGGNASSRAVLLAVTVDDAAAFLRCPGVAGWYQVWATDTLRALRAFAPRFEDVGGDRGITKLLIATELTPWDPGLAGGGRAGHDAALAVISRIRGLGWTDVRVAAIVPQAEDAPQSIDPAGRPIAGHAVSWADVADPQSAVLTGATRAVTIEDVPGPAAWEPGFGTRASEEEPPFEADAADLEGSPAGTRASGRGRKADGEAGERGAGGEAGGGGGDGGGGNEFKPEGYFETPDGERLAPKGALARARVALQLMFSPPEESRSLSRWTVAYWSRTQQWLRWNGRKYEEVRDETLRGMVLDFFEPWRVQTADKNTQRLALSTHQAMDIVEAMKTDASVHLETLPGWAPPTFDRDGRPRWGTVNARPPGIYGRNAIPFENGLLDVDRWKEDREIVVAPHSPLYVTTNAMAWELPVVRMRELLKADPHGESRGGEILAEMCPTFSKALAVQANGTDDYIQAIQHLFAYALDTTRHLEQMVYLIGQPGGGKGTILELLCTMLGMDAVAVSSLNDLSDKFARGAMVGKKVIIMDEVAAGPSTDLPEATRRVLSISGNAPQEIELKHRDRVPATRLNALIVMTGNKVQEFYDPAGAFGRRMVLIEVPRPYKGDPDPTFKSRVVKEVAGIVVWALFGLIDLAKRGRMVQPSSGLQKLRLFLRNSSRVRAFMSDCTVFDPEAGCTAEMLYGLFRKWSDSQGFGKPLQLSGFCADLAAAVDGFEEGVARIGGKQMRVWRGIRPKLVLDVDGRAEVRKTWTREEAKAAASIITGSGEYFDEDARIVQYEARARFAQFEFDVEEKAEQYDVR